MFARLAQNGATDAGVVLPGRYIDDDGTRTVGTVRNQSAIIDHARRLAQRIDNALNSGRAPLVLGGDCSLLLGAGLDLVSRGRFGLVHVDGHTDFRNPSNSSECASLAGEDLAAVVGRHWQSVSDVGGHGPYFRPIDAVHVGCRDNDAHLDETRSVLPAVIPASAVIDAGAARTAETIRSSLPHVTTYWLHVDVDVLDPEVMPAVDSPDPGGLQVGQLAELLTALAPGALGASVTIFDPDLDPDGRYASLLTELLCAPMDALGTGAGASPGSRAG